MATPACQNAFLNAFYEVSSVFMAGSCPFDASQGSTRFTPFRELEPASLKEILVPRGERRMGSSNRGR